MQGSDAAAAWASCFPDESELPNSSLAHYLALAVRDFGTRGQPLLRRARQGWTCDGLLRSARMRRAQRRPYALLGASYSFVHLIDALQRSGRRFRLPPGSRILDTGGYKGHSRELPLEDFYAALSQTFGVPRERCINMYGMTELSTQFYDDGNAHGAVGEVGAALDPLAAWSIR